MSGPYTKVWRVGNTLSDGGAILSVKHDGSFGTMPIGSVGQAELFGENGLIAAYSPDGHTVFEFRFLKTWPGDPDACGICLKAL